MSKLQVYINISSCDNIDLCISCEKMCNTSVYFIYFFFPLGCTQDRSPIHANSATRCSELCPTAKHTCYPTCTHLTGRPRGDGQSPYQISPSRNQYLSLLQVCYVVILDYMINLSISCISILLSFYFFVVLKLFLFLLLWILLCSVFTFLS